MACKSSEALNSANQRYRITAYRRNQFLVQSCSTFIFQILCQPYPEVWINWISYNCQNASKRAKEEITADMLWQYYRNWGHLAKQKLKSCFLHQCHRMVNWIIKSISMDHLSIITQNPNVCAYYGDPHTA